MSFLLSKNSIYLSCFKTILGFWSLAILFPQGPSFSWANISVVVRIFVIDATVVHFFYVFEWNNSMNMSWRSTRSNDHCPFMSNIKIIQFGFCVYLIFQEEKLGTYASLLLCFACFNVKRVHRHLFFLFHIYFFLIKMSKMIVANNKLDGVGPVDSRPSTNKLHHLIHKKKKIHLTRDMWHLTSDMWHVTCDTWQLTPDTWLVTRGRGWT